MMRHLSFVLLWLITASPVFAQSWTTPRTWVTGEVVTASQMNTHVRDNLSVLRGGGFAVTSQATGDLLCASSSTAFARLDGSHAVGQLLISTGTGACPAFGTAIDGSLSLSNASSVLTFSGATSPEILFSGANGNINSNNDLIFEIDKDSNGTEVFEVRNGASTALLQLTEAGVLFLNDSSNAHQTAGLTINQGTATDEIITLKNTNIAHGITDLTDTNTYARLQPSSANGGVSLAGYAEAGLGSSVVTLHAYITDAPATTKSSSTVGAVRALAQLKNGTSVTSVGANGAIFSIDNHGTTGLVVDAEGDLWLLGNVMLETGSAPQSTTPRSTGNVSYGIHGSSTNWLGEPAVWFVICNESATCYRVAGYTP